MGVEYLGENCSQDMGKPSVLPAAESPCTLGLVAQRISRRVSGYR